ncbi:hypothetical protein [Sodalis-like endosymbiont of Proechinophthirus fluctus]|nr:hypothetical protein [Sodalis-like endosymbiont of Proechinophthirus fluctus]
MRPQFMRNTVAMLQSMGRSIALLILFDSRQKIITLTNAFRQRL